MTTAVAWTPLRHLLLQRVDANLVTQAGAGAHHVGPDQANVAEEIVLGELADAGLTRRVGPQRGTTRPVRLTSRGRALLNHWDRDRAAAMAAQCPPAGGAA